MILSLVAAERSPLMEALIIYGGVVRRMIMKNYQYLMDESDAPFREDEYTRTLEDDIVLLNIVKRDGLELNPESRLYKLGKKLGML